MPDKNKQEWSADAAFWDNAWADMDQRLGPEQPRRKALIWWYWMLPLLLLAGVGGWAFWPGAEDVLEQDTPVKSSSGMVDPVAKASAGARQAETGKGKAHDAPAPTATLAVAPEYPADNNSVSFSPERKQTRASNPFSASTAPFREKRTGFSSPEPVAEPSVPRPSKTSSVEPDVPGKERAQRYSAAVEPLPGRTYTLPENAYRKTARLATGKQRVPLTVEAGWLTSSRLQSAGYYAGVGTEINSAGKVRFPVSLRYRRSDLLITSDSGRGNQDFAPALFDQGESVYDFNSLSSRGEVAGISIDQLRVRGIELSAGASFALAGRLRAEVNVGGEYLTSVRGLTSLTVTEDDLNLVFAGADQALTESYTLGAVGSDLAVQLSRGNRENINRVLLRGGTGLSYAITPTLSLRANVQQLLTPVYKEGPLRVQPTQFSAGVRYRIR